MSEYITSTCAALSSAKGKAGVSLIRVSGNDALKISSRVFLPKRDSLEAIPSNKAVYGDICDSNGNRFDNGIATVFRAPHSFTGEDTVEICCHGSEIGVSMLLSSLFDAGATPAVAGEFTKRAFLNGKLDLTQAEAVGALIDAESTAALRLSEAQTRGLLGKRISEISEKILMILSSVYAVIDYPDEDIADLSSAEMRILTGKILEEVTSLISTYDTGKAISQGVHCTIVGAPNVGKSSLLNMLCGSERAIVTDVAGTTRDIVTERVKVGNITLLLSDTAGIRNSGDKVEKIGIEKSKKAMAEAELILFVLDLSREIALEDREVMDYLEGLSKKVNVITILNKNDCTTVHRAEIEKVLMAYHLPSPVLICAENGDGKENLYNSIEKLYPAGDDEIRGGLILTNARQYASLSKAKVCLCNALHALDTLTPDMACAELEMAISALREADGRSVNEEIVNEIFSHFCVGK